VLENLACFQERITSIEVYIIMHQPDDEMNAEQLLAELRRLKEQQKRLEEENEALNIRANGVQVLSKLLDQSRLEATELKRKLAEKTNDGKLWSISSKDAVRRASSSGSLEKMGGLQHTSMSSSPWNTYDGNTLNEVMAELKGLLDKNRELTMDIENALRDQAVLNGDDRLLVEELNRLKMELDKYQSRFKGEYPGTLEDEANRLKAKLTDLAVQRGTKCGKIQDEIDLVKQKLQDIEEKFNSRMPEDFEDDKMEAEDTPQINIGRDMQNVDDNERMRDDLLNETSQGNETTGPAPVAKPRTKLDGEAEKQKKVIADLEHSNASLKAERDELIRVNHKWDKQYRKLEEYYKKLVEEMRNKDDSFQKLQRELSQEHSHAHGSVKDLLDQKDNTIEELNMKIRSLKEELDKVTLEGMQAVQRKLETETEMKYQRAKKLFQEQKKENEILIRKEETALQEIQVLKDAVEVLERETKSLNSRNRWLDGEIDRLTNLVEQSSERRPRSSPSSLMFQNEPQFRRQLSTVSEEQIEVLKQQIAIYAEDFNTEKLEKEKLSAEVNRLSAKLREAQNEAAECRRQMKIFENDYNMEKEENMRRARMRYGYEGEEGYVRRNSPARHGFQDEETQRRREYYQLMEERSRISDRMAELDRMRRPPPEHFLNTPFSARGSGQAQAANPQAQDKPSDNDMFFGGQVVRDLGGRNDKFKCPKCGIVCGSGPEVFRHELDCI